MMKNLYAILFVVFLLSFITPSTAQNIVLNPGVETWTTDTQPESWTVAENITKESTITHSGSFSAKHTSASSTKDFQQVIQGVVPGVAYTVQYSYFDNDDAAKSRIWAYWLAGTTTIDADAAILRPDTYSENSDQWQQVSVVSTAPANATAFRFEVRVYNQDGNNGGAVYYDDFVLSGEVTVKPEPTNYPTAFVATSEGMGARLNWVDAIGDQLPDAYLIMGEVLVTSKEILDVPVDGTPVANNLDITLGYISWNVTYGEQTHLFSSLEPNTMYNFTIYPYTNMGDMIDYKTDGEAPNSIVEMYNYQVMLDETFDADLGVMSAISVTGDQQWGHYNFNNEDYARMSGYEGGSFTNEDWLISPSITMNVNMTDVILNFRSARNYDGDALQLLVSSNYDGTGNPNDFVWDDITDAATWSAGSWAWAQSGNVSIQSYFDELQLNIAFKYTSTEAASATWQLDDVYVYGIVSLGMNELTNENLVVYPNPTADFVHFNISSAATITLSDITGRLVKEQVLSAGNHQLDLSYLNTGVYLLSVTTLNGQLHSAKVIVK